MIGPSPINCFRLWLCAICAAQFRSVSSPTLCFYQFRARLSWRFNWNPRRGGAGFISRVRCRSYLLRSRCRGAFENLLHFSRPRLRHRWGQSVLIASLCWSVAPLCCCSLCWPLLGVIFDVIYTWLQETLVWLCVWLSREELFFVIGELRLISEFVKNCSKLDHVCDLDFGFGVFFFSLKRTSALICCGVWNCKGIFENLSSI